MDLRNEERFRRVTLFQFQIILAIKKVSKICFIFLPHTLSNNFSFVYLNKFSFQETFFSSKLQRLFLWIVKIHPFHYFFILGLSVEGSCVLRHQVDCDSCLFCLSWAQIHLKATRLHFMAGSSLWQLSQLSYNDHHHHHYPHLFHCRLFTLTALVAMVVELPLLCRGRP